MRSGSNVDSILDNIAHGEQRDINTLLSVLPEIELILPVSTSRFSLHENPLESFSVPTFKGGDRKLIPVFSSEEFFSEWSNNRYDPIPVQCSALCETLGEDAWLVINPGQPNSLKLSPKEIAFIAASFTDVVEESPPKIIDEERRVVSNGPSSIDRGYEDRVAKRLQEMLCRYPEVSEAYLSLTKKGFAEAVLGLLTTQIRPDRRFNLMAEIAELSREFFGAAGAMEVYDDLNVKASRSWELFSSIAPFYERKTAELNEEERLGEKLAIEVEKEPNASVEDTHPGFFARKRTLLSRLFK